MRSLTREIRKWGGKVVLIKCKKDKSTSKIMKELRWNLVQFYLMWMAPLPKLKIIMKVI